MCGLVMRDHGSATVLFIPCFSGMYVFDLDTFWGSCCCFELKVVQIGSDKYFQLGHIWKT